MLKYFLIYLLIMNVLGFLMMAIDKSKAKHDKWRIPEKTLFIVAIIGGSVGSIIGMQVFRHKTKHAIFVVGMPLILILQVAAAVYLMTKLN